MRFEEQFPSLKDERVDVGTYFGESGTAKDKCGEYLHVGDVQEHCLDKQKVREAIQNLTQDCKKDNSIEWELDGQVDAEELLKELGLEDE